MLIDPYAFQPARIKRTKKEALEAVSIYVERPNGYDFKVGQHAVIRVAMANGSHLVRQYSFSLPPNKTQLRFTIVQESGGQVSSWFNKSAENGDVIEISKPFTGPLMQNTPRGEICMIAGGSGIAPLMAWANALREEQRPFSLLYSTHSNKRCFDRELTPLSGENITVRLTDTEPRFTKQEIIAALTTKTTVFICGSRPFVLAMRAYCETIVPPSNIFGEAFSL